MIIGQFVVDPLLVLGSRLDDVHAGLKRHTIYYGDDLEAATTLEQWTTDLKQGDKWQRAVEDCIRKREELVKESGKGEGEATEG